ncbi:MAG: spore maturation protein CgeB [Solirubrobacteraceae bacterium]|nr:spore maturation protein CgeB [Solirubrobacteraceae bacterium]
MRVLIIGEEYADSFADNLHSSLLDAGHEASCVGPFPLDRSRLPRLQARLRAAVASAPDMAARLQHHVVDAAEAARPDIVINLDLRVSYRLIERLRAAAGAPVVFWYPDSPGNLGRETHVVAGYDALFLKDSAIVERYRQTLGLDAFYLNEACNPRWHRPPDGAAAQDASEVLIAGNVNATRFRLIEELLDRGFSVTVHGPRWARWLPENPRVRSCWSGRYVTREEKARVFRSAAVVLNPLSSHEGDGMNCRLFEAAACGAAVLTEWRAGLPSLFDTEKEVRAYTSLDELAEQAHALIASGPEARAGIGDAAAARAHGEHTYVHRFDAICRALGTG